MFEFEVLSPMHIRLRVGRWHFRTWRSVFMRLPKSYTGPETVYEVVLRTEDDEHTTLVYGAFFSEKPALALIERLVVDGKDRDRLGINLIDVYVRLDDYEWNR